MQSSVNRGKFISFEGCEASGKSTQVMLLKEYLEQEGIKVVATKEPGGTELALKIRSLMLSQEIFDPLTESFLIAAARRDHVCKIEEYLHAGLWVISDRFIDSSRVYQGMVKGLDQAIVEELILLATGGLSPDITFVLDIDVCEMQLRLKNSTIHNTFYDGKGIEFHEGIKKGFLRICDDFKDRVRKIDGNKDKFLVNSDIVDIISKWQ